MNASIDRQPSVDEIAGMAWWNGLSEPSRAFWLRQAGPSAAHAWARYQQLVGVPGSEDGHVPGYESPASFIRRLLVLAIAASEGDQSAQAELRRSGELMEFAGGVHALVEVQGLAHDYQVNHPEVSKGRDLAGLIGAYWEHIDSWAKL